MHLFSNRAAQQSRTLSKAPLPSTRLRHRWTVLAASIGFSLAGIGSTDADEAVRFNRDVRPILSNNCFHCHGPDEHDRRADLRLDTQEGIRRAFAAGSLDDSEAWQRLTSEDMDERMPPPDSHLEVTPEQMQVLSAWINSGAEWEGHWSFIPPSQPGVPAVNRAWWPRNPIDRFVLAKLESLRVAPSPPADRETLIRRVTLDLTGLPPTLEEIDQFLQDRDANAFEKVVDRLLASDAFGERMAVGWLDAARYGDTSVFHADGHRDMWPYRDWVIRSFNQNLPYDQFTVHQLAGDLLPNATNETKIASAFNRNNATTDEGGAIAEEFRVEYAVDRVNTTATVWMALTLQCAQCHDHKYDPIAQDDYYRFYAFFNQASDPGMQTRRGNQSPVVDVFDPLKLAAVDQEQQKLDELKQQIAKYVEAAEGPFATWLGGIAQAPEAGHAAPEQAKLHCSFAQTQENEAVQQIVNLASDRVADQGQVHGKPTFVAGRVGTGLSIKDNAYLEFPAVGDFERDHEFSLGGWARFDQLKAGALASRMDDPKAHRGFDLLVSNKGHLQVHIVHAWPNNAIKVETTKPALTQKKWQHVFATYDGSSKAAGVKLYVDGVLQETRAEKDALSDTIRTEQPFRIGRRSTGSNLVGQLDEFRVYDRVLSTEQISSLSQQGPLDDWLATPAANRTAEQREALQLYYLKSQDEKYGRLTKRVAAQRKQVEDLKKPVSTVMVMQDVAKPRMTYVLNRGSYSSPMKDRPVEPTTLSMLPSMPEGTPSNRLGMAQWLVMPDHPLTARVAVNRYWQLLFGIGLVETSDDFGSQGAWPSHPALLDWLAVDFVKNGWDVKRAIKQMVMSATYQQSGRVRSELSELDPNNRLLARSPRFRLQAEFLRDNALATSGLLVHQLGGPSVKPYQPPGLWNEVSLDGNLRFKQDHGDSLYRRSLYIYWRRSAPPPSMTLFDAPSREKCVINRSRTNTPLQALVTLNDVQYVEAARALAEQSILRGGKRLDDRLAYAYRRATGRYPDNTKLDVLREAYQEEHAVFAADPKRAEAWLGHGESKRDGSIDAVEHAAMTVVTSIILNLDETLTRG